MSGIAAYKAQLKLGGVPTAFVDEPLVRLAPTVYRITDPLKRILSANHSIVIEDAINTDISNIISKINYLEGIILFSEDPESPFDAEFTINGYYIPLQFIGGAKEYSLEIGGDILDDTAFHSDTELTEGFRTKVQGIHDVSGSFSRFASIANSNAIKQAKLAKTPVFVSINPGASKTFIKGWYHIETDSFSGDIGALEEESISLTLCGNNAKTYFSYSFNYTLAEANALTEQELIDNYFVE